MNGNPCEFVLAAHRWIVPLRRCSGCEELLLSFSLSLCSNNYFLRVSARLSNCVCDWGDVIRRHSPYPFHPLRKKQLRLAMAGGGAQRTTCWNCWKNFSLEYNVHLDTIQTTQQVLSLGEFICTAQYHRFASWSFPICSPHSTRCSQTPDDELYQRRKWEERHQRSDLSSLTGRCAVELVRKEQSHTIYVLHFEGEIYSFKSIRMIPFSRPTSNFRALPSKIISPAICVDY